MSREPLVLLHGVTMSGQVWDPLLPALSERYRVAAPTARHSRAPSMGGVGASRSHIRDWAVTRLAPVRGIVGGAYMFAGAGRRERARCDALGSDECHAR